MVTVTEYKTMHILCLCIHTASTWQQLESETNHQTFNIVMKYLSYVHK